MNIAMENLRFASITHHISSLLSSGIIDAAEERHLQDRLKKSHDERLDTFSCHGQKIEKIKHEAKCG